MQGIPFEMLPKKGLVMAYFKERLVFSPYEMKNGMPELPERELFEKEMPYECHFFDCDTEFRMITRASRRDRIERVLTREEEISMPAELLFCEDVLVKPEYAAISGVPKSIRVINRYRYSENDTLVLSDYRISMIPGCDV